MSRIFSLIWLLLPLLIFSQKVDVMAIGKAISDPESPYYYDRLEYKYRGLPQMLDKDEAKHLYYGRLFLQDIIGPYDPRFNELRSAFERGNYDKCVQLGRELYHLDSTNLDILLIYMKGLENTKDFEGLSPHIGQIRALTDAILESGDGKSEKTAYVVNTIGDEYILLNMLRVGMDFKRQSRAVRDSMLDIWSNGTQTIYINVLYTNL